MKEKLLGIYILGVLFFVGAGMIDTPEQAGMNFLPAFAQALTWPYALTRYLYFQWGG